MAHRFVVQLDGIELSSEQERALNASIQQAALAHLATIDTRGDAAAAIFGPHGGQTKGIYFVPVEPMADIADRVAAARDALE